MRQSRPRGDDSKQILIYTYCFSGVKMRDMPKATVVTQCLMAAPLIVSRPATAEGRCNVAVDLITNFDTTSKYEPPRDKTNKMIVRPAKTQISPGIRQSDQSLRCPHEESLGP